MGFEFEFESLVVYDSRLFYPGSHVSRWANAVERGFVANAIKNAPMRSGELRSGIHGESFRSGVKHWEVHIHSDAPHSLYVLKGTQGPIMSNRMWRFRNNPRYAHLEVPRGGARSGNPLWGKTFGYDMEWLRKHGYALKVRAGNGYPERYMLWVEGQDANNFMAEAADATARTHSSLRGFSPGFGF